MRISDACLDQLFFKARTANGFTDQAVPADLLQQVYDIAKMGATSMNTQPARYVFLNSPEARARLIPALAPGNVDKTKVAPVTVIVASDMHFYEHMPVVWHKPGAKEMFEGNKPMADGTAVRNSTLSGAYFMIAARAVGPWRQVAQHLRGSVVVIDEAQNCTYGQLKMLLTRLGWHSTMVVTGDPNQSDLLPGVSGLADVANRFEALDSVAVVRLGDVDIVRHPLVAEMLGVL